MYGRPTTFRLIQGTDEKEMTIDLDYHAKTSGPHDKRGETGMYLHKKCKPKYIAKYEGDAHLGNDYCYMFPQSMIIKDYNRDTPNLGFDMENIMKLDIDDQAKIRKIEKYIYRYKMITGIKEPFISYKWNKDELFELKNLYDMCIKYQNSGYSNIVIYYGF